MKKLQIFLIVLYLFSNCTLFSQPVGSLPVNDSSVTYSFIKTYDIDMLKSILGKQLSAFMETSTMKAAAFNNQLAVPRYAVKLYRVHYASVVPELGNRRTFTDGLLAVPDNDADSLAVVSYQHGTIFSKNEVPSMPDNSMETRLMIAQFAAQGYMVIAADYFGEGNSDLPNTYLIQKSSEQACLDMLFASRIVSKALHISQTKLFVHGWSQGGYVNMAFLRRLEEMNIPVTAATTASAPVDAFSTVNRWINNYQPIDAVYLPGVFTDYIFALEAYEDMPGLPAAILKPEYYQAAKDFYDWKIDWPTYRKLTSDTLPKMLKPEFLASGDIANTKFWKFLDNAQVCRWRCKTPLRNFYGEKDEVVPVFIAKLPEAYHKLFGSGLTEAIDAGANADHRATYIYSIIHGKKNGLILSGNSL